MNHPAGINGTRLWSRIDELASIGITRLAFSEEDLAARRQVLTMMEEAGLDPRIDAAANIIGRREGTDPAAPPIACGSHIDTVRNGGRFDGVLGCLAGIECVHTLHEAGIRTTHPLEVIVFANEEGQTFASLSGSKAMAGLLPPEELARKDAGGRTLGDALRQAGGDPLRLDDARRPAGSMRAYVELHVEQGGVLEDAGVPIGIVEGIVGILYHDVRITGYANHAGATPMPLRRDALVAASKFVVAVNDTVRSAGFCAVGTVGRMEVLPNAPNVIPGEVRLTLGLRDLDMSRIRKTADALRQQAGEIAREHGVHIEFTPRPAVEPAIAEGRVMDAIRTAAGALKLVYKVMPSGAGHDAQMMARIAPMGMIFVPSAGGVSHSDDEFTSLDDCVNGTNVLLGTILTIDGWR